ncbi:unnamed protein product, partial [marine sediment metagenome]
NAIYTAGSMFLTIPELDLTKNITDATGDDEGYLTGPPGNQQLILNLGNLPVGTIRTLKFSMTGGGYLVNNDEVLNRASADAENVEIAWSEASLVTLCADPELAFTKNVDKAQAYAGEVLQYSLNYQVTGGDLHNAVITDEIPELTTFANEDMSWSHRDSISSPINLKNLTPGDGDDEGTFVPGYGERGQVVFALGTLAEGSSGWVNFKVKINDDAQRGDEILNTAVMDANEVDPIEDDALTVIIADDPPIIDIFKDVDKSVVYPGDYLDYTLSYSISGETTAENVVITDTIPEHTVYVTGSMYEVLGSTLNNLTDADDNDVYDFDVTNADMMTFTLGNLEPGSSGLFTFQVQVDDDAPTMPFPLDGYNIRQCLDRNDLIDGVLQNDSNITADNADPGMSCVASFVITAPLPELTIDKQVDKATANPGDTLYYTIDYTNIGEGDAHNTKVYDYYNTSLITPTEISGNGVDMGGQIEWYIGTLAAGASGTVTWSGELIDTFP